MNITEALSKRILEICDEQKTSICDICVRAGLSPNNIYDLLNKRSKYPRIKTIQRFCEGANISITEFFTSELFQNLEQED